MLNFRQSKCLKVIAILVILTFVPVQTSWAGRGRRGGNATGALIIAAIGGAAMPLTIAIAGGNAAYLALAGSAVGTVLAKAGVDPRVNALVTAAVQGILGGGLASIGQSADIVTRTIIIQVVKRVVMAEVSYELNRAGLGPLAGLAAAGAGIAVDGVVAGLGGEASWNSFIKGSTAAKQPSLGARIVSTLVVEGISGLIQAGLQAAAGDNQLAMRYGGNISNLGGSLAGAYIGGPLGEAIFPGADTGQSTTYRIADKIDPGNFRLKDSRKATAEEIQTLKGLEDGKTYQLAKDGITVVEYKLQGDNIIISEANSTKFTAQYKNDMERRGYAFKVDNKGRVLELIEAQQAPRFVWESIDDKGHHMWDTWNNSIPEQQRYDLGQSWKEDNRINVYDSTIKSVKPTEYIPRPIPQMNPVPSPSFDYNKSQKQGFFNDKDTEGWKVGSAGEEVAGAWGLNAQPAQAKAQPETIGPYAIADAAFTPVSNYSPGVEYRNIAAETVHIFNSQLGDFAPAHITGDTF